MKSQAFNQESGQGETRLGKALQDVSSLQTIKKNTIWKQRIKEEQ